MDPIIRTPALSGEKRTLGVKAPAAATPAPTPAVTPVASTVAAQSATAAPAPVPRPQPTMPPAATPVPAPAAQPAGPSKAELERLVADTRRQALEAAQVEAARLRELAQQQGYAAGLEQARAEIEQQAEQQAKRWQALQQTIEQGLRTSTEQVEEEAAAVAFEAVCKIVGDEAGRIEGVLAMVRQVLARVRQDDGVTIRLSPAALAMLGQEEELPELLGGIRVHWIADETVAAGCVVEAAVGQFDARLDRQLERLRDALLAINQAESR
ncbi:FliH/SctL family protein [Chitinimonas lacunae]|uniref:Flagellar assembly protein FliH n=1 Tax=Chitinimonas lacunae TaxID=1963018 RepID=A0ABV8MXJ7_9NEIS